MTFSLPLADLRRRAPRRVVRTVAYLLPLAYYVTLLVTCVRPAAVWWALAVAAATLAAGLLLVPRGQLCPVGAGTVGWLKPRHALAAGGPVHE